MSVEKKEVKKANTRQFTGTIVSNKMDKTVIVKVDRTKMHKLYGKQFVKSMKYKVHDPKNICKVGDTVRFVECRPLSKDKKWRIIGQ